MVSGQVSDCQPTKEVTGTENGYPIIEYLDLDVRGVGVIAVDNRVKQGLTQRGQRLGKTFRTLQAAIEDKGHADV